MNVGEGLALMAKLEVERENLRLSEEALESLFEDRGAWRNHPEGEAKSNAIKAINTAIAIKKSEKREAEFAIKSIELRIKSL